MAADEETEEGGSCGVEGEHECGVEHPECVVPGHMSTLYLHTERNAELTLRSHQGLEKVVAVTLERMPEGS